MRRINGKRIISSTMCALMIASLSMPTVSTYGAEVTVGQETRGVERIGDTVGITYQKMTNISSSFKSDVEGYAKTYNGIKFGIDSYSGTSIGDVVLPKAIKEFLGWDYGMFGWGDNGAKVQKLGSGKIPQSFSFESDSNTKVSHIEFQSIVEVVIPANTTIHFVDSTFKGKVTVEQGGSVVFENCKFENSTEHMNGEIENNGNASYQGSTTEPTNTAVQTSPTKSALVLDDVTLIKNIGEVGKAYSETLTYMLTGTNKDTAKVEATVFPADKGIVASANNVGGTVTVTISGNPTETGTYTITTKAIDIDDTFVSKSVTLTINEMSKQVVPFILTKLDNTLSEGITETAYNGTITYTLMGTNSETATVSAKITPSNGLSAQAVNDRGTVKVTVSGTPTVVGEFTVTTTVSADGNASINQSEKAMIIGAEIANATELVLDDNYYSFDVQLREKLRNATTIKLANNNLTVSKPKETTIIPKQVTKFIGWQVKSFFEPEGEKVQRLGSGGTEQTLTFEEGSNVIVRNITFEKGVHVVVPKGVTVTFEHCTFNQTMTNEGTAVFNHCTFATGEIINNGGAEYTNGTIKPTNLGVENPNSAHFPLGMNLSLTTLKDGVTGQEYIAECAYELSGNNKAYAMVTAEVVEKESGLTAKVENGKIIVLGTPTKVMAVSIKVVANAMGDTPVEKILTLNTHAPFQVELAGSINCMVMPKEKAKVSRLRVDAVSRATGSAGGGSSSGVILPDGSVSAQNTLTPYIIAEDGTKTNWLEYRRDNKDATIETKVFPEGSGVTAECLFGTVTLKGEPLKTGEYFITVTVKDKGQEVTSNKIDFRIYRGNETLKEQLGTLKAKQEFWDVEPYEIVNSNHAVIPTTLKKIYGSHQSGTYAVIGNSDIDKVDTDTIVIPSGCDVTFENVKIYSSIRIIVEKGGALTLSDSVSFGKIEVNGGTFAMGNSSAICDTLILNDGSTVKGKEIKVMTPDGIVTNYGTQIKSHAHFLSDGSDKEYSPENVVIVNGTVTVDGDVEIQGDVGSGRLRGQTALCVKGDLVIPAGSTVKTLGGGAAPEDQTYLPAKFGGNGIVLQNGRILGQGSLITIGGISYDGRAGHGITGNGDIMVHSLESAGGDATLFLPGYKVIGGDAVQKDVAVMTKPENMKLTAGRAKKMDGTFIGGTENGIDGTAIIVKTTPTVVREEQTNGGGSGIPFLPTAPIVSAPTSSMVSQQKSEDKKKDDVTPKVEKEKSKKQKETKKSTKVTKSAKKETQKESKKQEKTKATYYKKMTGTSIVNVLKALKIDSSFATRKKIAEANGIKNYTGTETQNAKLLELAQKGKLKQPKTMKANKKSRKLVKMSTKSIKKANKK